MASTTPRTRQGRTAQDKGQDRSQDKAQDERQPSLGKRNNDDKISRAGTRQDKEADKRHGRGHDSTSERVS